MWWKFSLTVFLFALFIGGVATTSPHKTRSLHVFVAALSFYAAWRQRPYGSFRTNSAATVRHITECQCLWSTAPASAGRVGARLGSFRFVPNVDEASVLPFD